MEKKTLYEYIENYQNTDKNQTFKDENNNVFIINNNPECFMIFGTDEYEDTKIENIDKYKIKYKDEDKAYKYRYYAYFELKQEKCNTSQDKKILTFVLFNPSYSNPENLDPTTKNCIKIAEKEEYSAIEIINLYPFRSAKVISKIFNKNNKEANKINRNLIKAILDDEEKNRHFVLAWGMDKNKEKKDEGKEKMIGFVLGKFKNKTVKKISITAKAIEDINKKYLHPGSSLNIFGCIDDSVFLDDVKLSNLLTQKDK